MCVEIWNIPIGWINFHLFVWNLYDIRYARSIHIYHMSLFCFSFFSVEMMMHFNVQSIVAFLRCANLKFPPSFNEIQYIKHSALIIENVLHRHANKNMKGVSHVSIFIAWEILKEFTILSIKWERASKSATKKLLNQFLSRKWWEKICKFMQIEREHGKMTTKIFDCNWTDHVYFVSKVYPAFETEIRGSLHITLAHMCWR